MACHVITVAQQKGGAGKSTVTAHLAVALCQRGLRVAVVDIDPQGSLTQWHQIREERLGEDYTGLYFVSLSGWRVGSEVARLKKHHDVVLIDSPPHVETEARTAIRNADLLLIPVQPSPTDLWATKATLELARSERKPVRVIMNRVNAQSRITDLIAGEFSGLMKSRLANRVLFATSLIDGMGVTEAAPSSLAAQEIHALADEVLGLIPRQLQPLREEEREMA